MTRSKEPAAPHRRGHTRWLMIIPLTGLAIVIACVILLEALAPRPGPSPEPVTGIPPLAVQEGRPCARGGDEALLDELRDEQRAADGRISSTHVFLCPAAYDDLPVTYAGEVIGDLLHRGDGAWVQVNDDAYALEVGPLVGHKELDGFNSGLSVWLPDGLHERIEHVGRAGRRGDVILVSGTLLQSDPQDGGGITLRADELEVLAEGVEVDEPLHVLQLIVAGLLAVGAIGTTVWARRSR